MSDQPSSPKVKLTADFKKGDTVIHKDTREELEILRITKEGDLKCQKRVKVGDETKFESVGGLIPAGAVRKKTP